MKKQYRKKTAIFLVLVLCITGLYRFDCVKADEGNTLPSFTGISDTSDAAMKLAEQLVGDDIKIENAQLIGDVNAFGTFENAYDIVGFPSGIVLATGNLNQNPIFDAGYIYFMGENSHSDAPVSEEDAKKYGFYEEGDYPSENPDIRAYYEPAILQFDITPETDTLSFQYMVASEEYPEYIEQYWDKFVLCVNDVNYALLPDKNETITIGNINSKKNSEYYRGLTIKDGISIDEALEAGDDPDKIEQYFDTGNAISADHFIFDGATKVFSVNAPVNKGAVNTIRLAIADYSDDLYDSAVFIKANSIKSKPALYGNIHIKHVDNKEGVIYLERRGGYVGAVSVDLKFLGQGDGELCNAETIEFKDGEYLQSISVKDRTGLESLKYLELTNPTGGVQINEGERIDYDNWITTEALKIFYSLVKGTVYEMKNGEAVKAPNAAVKIKSSDGSILETKTDSNGEYKIDYVTGGLHSIAAVNEDESITKENSFYLSLDDIENKGKVLDIYLDQQIIIDNPKNTNIIIEGLDTASEGKNAKVTISQPSADAAVDALITETEKKLKAAALYTLDIKLELENTGGYENQTNLNTPISLTFPIPEEADRDSDYYIYHIHNGGAETQTLYDMDNDPDTITVKTDKLSQFVLMQSGDTSDKIETDAIQSMKQQVEEQVTKAVEEAEKQVAENNPATPTPTPAPGTPTPTPSVPTPTPGTPAPTPQSPSPAPGSPSPAPSAPADNITTPPSNNNNNNSSGSPSTDGTPTPAPTPDADKDSEKEQAKKELEKVTVPAKINMYTGQVKSIKPENLPEGAKVTYKSSKKSVADVKASGKITVKKTGKAVITTTVTYKDISRVYKTAITVKKPYIDIKEKKTTMKAGQVYQFKAKVYGSSGKVTWSVSDKSKASINKNTGKLKAKKAGKITVYAKSGKITKKITVKIKA